MSFDFGKLNVLSAITGGFAHYHYATADTAEEVEAPGYFSTVAAIYLAVDNQLTVSCAEGSAVYFVTGKAEGTVTVQRVTEISQRKEAIHG